MSTCQNFQWIMNQTSNILSHTLMDHPWPIINLMILKWLWTTSYIFFNYLFRRELFMLLEHVWKLSKKTKHKFPCWVELGVFFCALLYFQNYKNTILFRKIAKLPYFSVPLHLQLRGTQNFFGLTIPRNSKLHGILFFVFFK
jgi:hypothetical protein